MHQGGAAERDLRYTCAPHKHRERVAGRGRPRDPRAGRAEMTGRPPDLPGESHEVAPQAHAETPAAEQTSPTPAAASRPREIGGPAGPEPTRYGDWERNGRCFDF